jgi:hypothetical protein
MVFSFFFSENSYSIYMTGGPQGMRWTTLHTLWVRPWLEGGVCGRWREEEYEGVRYGAATGSRGTEEDWRSMKGGGVRN